MKEPLQQHPAQTDGRLRTAQLKMLVMLKTVDAICKKHQLDYWLEGGTLLGAVRHQGFIPWDDDLDISMPRASFNKFIQVAADEFPDNLLLQTPQTDPGYFNLSVPLKIRDKNSLFIELHEQGSEPYHHGIFLDVFVYDAIPSDLKKRKRDKFRAKKLQRLLSHKYCPVAMGHHATLYKLLSKFVPQAFLERQINKIIDDANKQGHVFLGYGYDCVNSNCVAYEDIYPLKKIQFEDSEFNIANRSEVILTQLYGDYMTMPPEHQRIMCHCRELIPELDKAGQ